MNFPRQAGSPAYRATRFLETGRVSKNIQKPLDLAPRQSVTVLAGDEPGSFDRQPGPDIQTVRASGGDSACIGQARATEGTHHGKFNRNPNALLPS